MKDYKKGSNKQHKPKQGEGIKTLQEETPTIENQ